MSSSLTLWLLLVVAPSFAQEGGGAGVTPEAAPPDPPPGTTTDPAGIDYAPPRMVVIGPAAPSLLGVPDEFRLPTV